MNYFITDDDPSVRAMLKDIIVDEDLGEIVSEASDGAGINDALLINHKVDILLIDMLMPNQDGITTIQALRSYKGKIVMISQVESKELIGEAYSIGVEYYVTKPINRLEVINILKKVNERIQLENSINGIKDSLNLLNPLPVKRQKNTFRERNIQSAGSFVLSELGIFEEKGSKDLLNILKCLSLHEESSDSYDYVLPSLKTMFHNVSELKLGSSDHKDIKKEVKACEQRIRRCIYHALTHIAALGIDDYSNPTFEKYASKLFEYSQVMKTMQRLKNEDVISPAHTRINTKKFIHALYTETKKQMGS
ncbi:transcriptional regulator [Anaerobacillus alkalidiazotrophicus]|uniref:Transcriptional regulator n=1 Tax=Anaerobacillus alkalidiazotrophicus TaxID=472963 RepID=A0A1S2LWQ2_9BACI|nr:response regulator [Anaerobacillus alkalidiazotrophicus]OIJ16958.1 transcriptional regulator [Anaerobacillus alkalidiazotrophicus]